MSTKSAKPSKESPVTKFVNKTHEVYDYVSRNPNKNDREILDALKHMNAPVVHASLRSLCDGGYLSKTEISELNKLGRKMNRYKATSKPYEPRVTRLAKAGARKASAKTLSPISDRLGDRKRVALDSSVVLTVPTSHGPVTMPLAEAQDVYNELKKVFGAR